jgi:putative ABC transport system substrate-binding protein
MDRRQVLLMALAGAVAWPLTAEAEQTGRLYRVGLLVGAPPQTPAERAQSPLRSALRDLGWIEGHNVAFDERRTLNLRQLVPAAIQLVQLKVDVIFANGVAAVRAAQNATASIPVIMLVGPDPVSERLVASLQRPGGNVTGVTTLSTDLIAKRLGLIKEIMPNASRVAYVVNPTNPGNVSAAEEIGKVASTVGLVVQPVPVRGPEDFDRTLAELLKDRRVDAALVGIDGMLVAHRARLAELAAKHRIPFMYSMREYAEAGGLIVYTADYSAVYRSVAVFIDKVLRGANPADLPVEQPTRFELVINLKAAKALGLVIPPSLLVRADQIIE